MELYRASDSFVLKNKSDKTYEFMWNAQKFVLHPHSEVIVPFPLVINYFGDPRAGEDEVLVPQKHGGGAIAPRAEYVLRLKKLYYVDLEASAFNSQNISEHELAQNVEVYDAHRNLVITPLHDPNYLPKPPTFDDMSELEKLRLENYEMNKRIEELNENMSKLIIGETKPQQIKKEAVPISTSKAKSKIDLVAEDIGR